MLASDIYHRLGIHTEGVVKLTISLLSIRRKSLANVAGLLQIDMPVCSLLAVLQCEAKDSAALLDGVFPFAFVGESRGDQVEGAGGWEGI